MTTTFDILSVYILTNAYTYQNRQLASDGTNIFMNLSNDADPTYQWYLSSSPLDSFFRFHTIANGNILALDVVNNNGTNSTQLQFAPPAAITSQYWLFVRWGQDTTFRIVNNYTGVDKHLDTYSDTLEPFLGDGDATGQHWYFNRIGSLPSSLDTRS